MEEATDRRIRQRADRWLEMIGDNHSLRDDLDDPQARQLIDWGTRQVLGAAEAAEAALDPDSYMEESVMLISRVMRQVNGLAPNLMYLVEEDMAAELLESYVSSLAELTGRDLGERWVAEALTRRLRLDEAATFQHLIHALYLASGEEE